MAIRSRQRLIAKTILLPLGLIVAAAAFVHAGSETETFSLGPGASARLGLDAHIATALADSGFRVEMARRQPQTQGGFPRLPDSLVALAQESFAVDPLEVTSLRTIALGGVLQEDEDQARRLMRLAAQISKRDSITDLWLAQDYGQGGEIEAMIASFDHALRTSMRAREFAMKPVVDALASENTYAPLGKLLAGSPEWEVDFWKEFARNPVAAANAAPFLSGSGIPVSRIPEAERTSLYENLKREGRFGTIHDFAASDPAAKTSAQALAAGEFITVDEGNPLGWTLHSSGGASAQIHRSTGELQIDARPGSFGIAADRLVRVDGDRKLAVVMAEPVPDGAQIKLALKCVGGDDQELASISLTPGDTGGDMAFEAGRCDFASLDLSFIVNPGRRDAFLRIARIQILPA